MSENVILIAGVLCFALTLIGMILTVVEFRRMGKSEAAGFERKPSPGAASRPAFRT